MAEFIVAVPEGVDTSADGDFLRVKGPKGELRREFRSTKLKLQKKDGGLVISTESTRKKDQALMGTWRALLKTMMTGVTKGYACRLKLVFSHFPIKLEAQGDRLVIKNFLGERSSRTAEIVKGVQMKIEGDMISLQGIDKEKVGQSAANIERATKIRGLDRRVFQDGLYITQKTSQQGEGG
jgi:large subunit ribosomal protein L6